MQQTKKYKFNIIENTDTFSPEALNENTEAVEAQLDRVETAHAVDKAALLAAIGSVGQTARVVCGSYVGDGVYDGSHPGILTFDFRPVLVLVGNTASEPLILIRGSTRVRNNYYNCSGSVTWEDRSVSWSISSSQSGGGPQFDVKDATYYYVAIGVDN